MFGGANHVNRLARIQAISGLGFALFLALHLATTASDAGGPATYDGTLVSMRALYRAHPLVEFLLVGATAAVHLACAVLRILERRRFLEFKALHDRYMPGMPAPTRIAP